LEFEGRRKSYEEKNTREFLSSGGPPRRSTDKKSIEEKMTLFLRKSAFITFQRVMYLMKGGDIKSQKRGPLTHVFWLRGEGRRSTRVGRCHRS